MRPCDWPDEHTAHKHDVQGIGHNEWRFTVVVPFVVIQNTTTTMRVPMKRMKQFAEWYLDDKLTKGWIKWENKEI